MNNSGRPIKLHTLRKVFPPSTHLLYKVLASDDGDNNNNDDDDDNGNTNKVSILAVDHANCILIESSRDPLHFLPIFTSRATTTTTTTITTPGIRQIPIPIQLRRFRFWFHFADFNSASLRFASLRYFMTTIYDNDHYHYHRQYQQQYYQPSSTYVDSDEDDFYQPSLTFVDSDWSVY